MKKILGLLMIVILTTQLSYSAIIDTTRVYGITIDAVSRISNTVTALSNMCKKPTTRIVFDEFIPATDYQNAVNQIHNVSFIMGEILDSYYMKQYTLAQYQSRMTEYLNLLGDKVDIWEIGNEVNGEWLGSISDVVAKINAAYSIVKAQNKKTALTLYYNKVCYEKSDNEMFYWVNKNVSSAMRTGLDYVWISYYEDDCNNHQPNWQQVFDSLHTLFPNSKIGIGECGTTKSKKKSTYINRYYKMNINTPNYVGGYFWWYYRQDCVPHTKTLWATINAAINSAPGEFTDNGQNIFNENSDNNYFLGNNYPNPFNPTTRISYTLPEDNFVTLKIYDNLGREVATLVNETKTEGSYSVDFNARNFSTGVYYYKLVAGNFTDTKRMLLIK